MTQVQQHNRGIGRLAGKTALVTGAGSGFGAAIAERFAAEGCRVLLADINEDAVSALSQRLNDEHGRQQGGGGSSSETDRRTAWIKMDVTSEADWTAAVAACGILAAGSEAQASEGGAKLDIVVNNAGTTYRNKPTLEVTGAEFDRVFAVNVRSIFLAVQAVVPALRRAGGGSIINISSIGSVRPRPGLVWYNASKGAVTNATKGLAAEFGPDKIRVNAIAPLLSGTGLFESFVGVPDTPENRENFVANVPLGRLTETVDVANAALYLASDEGSFVNGVNLEVDGGRAV